jgi:hypothetical protein
MFKYLLILSTIFFIGCTMSRSMEVKVAGNNIRTIYGAGDAGIEYKSNTTTGFLNGRN